MFMFTAASVEKLTPLLSHEYGDGAKKQAKRIRAIWKADGFEGLYNVEPELVSSIEHSMYHATPNDIKRVAIDSILCTSGVEYLGRYKPSGDHVDYCNTGDSYAPTIIFIGNRLIVGCWEDMVERNQITEGDLI